MLPDINAAALHALLCALLIHDNTISLLFGSCGVSLVHQTIIAGDKPYKFIMPSLGSLIVAWDL